MSHQLSMPVSLPYPHQDLYVLLGMTAHSTIPTALLKITCGLTCAQRHLISHFPYSSANSTYLFLRSCHRDHIFTSAFSLPTSTFSLQHSLTPSFYLNSLHPTQQTTMFVRLDKDLPEDPSYPADLAALGYKVNETGEFVKVNDAEGTHKHFTFFISDNGRVNETHKEAMHIAAREVVTKELAKLGVKEVYLTGESGAVLEEVKPEGPHLSLYATDLDALNGKNNVVVIVGEHNQDPGVFAYRMLMREGGIANGEYAS